jgi:PmbA protein
MKIDTLKKLLQASEADAWEIHTTITKGWEFYFIRHELDQNRIRSVSHTHVTVYRNLENDMMGKATAEFYPTETDADCRKKLDTLLERAVYSRSHVYSLVTEEEVSSFAPKEQAFSLADTSEAFMKTLGELDETKTHDVNSYEIFVNDQKIRYINSNGVDMEEAVPDCFLEVILDARDDSHEIELYRSCHSGSCDSEYLKVELNQALKAAEDRLHTSGTPSLGKAPVLFSTADALAVYSFFKNGLLAEAVYNHVSPFKLNQAITEAETGDKITLSAHRYLPNSSQNHLFDHDGCLIRDTVMMKDNVPVHWEGRRQYAQYLNLEDSFEPGNYEVSGGTKSCKELREQDYLEPIEFSDFQVDRAGNLFGEIRLAYWHHDGEITPVSGGSVSGNVMKLMGGFHMSKEQKQYDHALIPAVTLIDDVTITGVK